MIKKIVEFIFIIAIVFSITIALVGVVAMTNAELFVIYKPITLTQFAQQVIENEADKDVEARAAADKADTRDYGSSWHAELAQKAMEARAAADKAKDAADKAKAAADKAKAAAKPTEKELRAIAVKEAGHHLNRDITLDKNAEARAAADKAKAAADKAKAAADKDAADKAKAAADKDAADKAKAAADKADTRDYGSSWHAELAQKAMEARAAAETRSYGSSTYNAPTRDYGSSTYNAPTRDYGSSTYNAPTRDYGLSEPYVPPKLDFKPIQIPEPKYQFKEPDRSVITDHKLDIPKFSPKPIPKYTPPPPSNNPAKQFDIPNPGRDIVLSRENPGIPSSAWNNP